MLYCQAMFENHTFRKTTQGTIRQQYHFLCALLTNNKSRLCRTMEGLLARAADIFQMKIRIISCMSKVTFFSKPGSIFIQTCFHKAIVYGFYCVFMFCKIKFIY